MDPWRAVRDDDTSTLTRVATADGIELAWRERNAPALGRWAALAWVAVTALAGATIVVLYKLGEAEATSDPALPVFIAALALIAWIGTTLISGVLVGWGRTTRPRELTIDGRGIHTPRRDVPWSELRTLRLIPRARATGPSFSIGTALADAPSGDDLPFDPDDEPGSGGGGSVDWDVNLRHDASDERVWAVSLETADDRVIVGRQFTEAEAMVLVRELDVHRPRGGVRDSAAERAVRHLRQQAD